MHVVLTFTNNFSEQLHTRLTLHNDEITYFTEKCALISYMYIGYTSECEQTGKTFKISKINEINKWTHQELV